jgi:hypothetical protein
MILKRQWIVLLLCIVLVCAVVLTCQKKHSEQTPIPESGNNKGEHLHAELDCRLLQAELALIKSDSLYLVLNLKQNELQLKMKGVVVWNSPINLIETDSQGLAKFARRFQGEEELLIRPISYKHLFTAQNKTPDSILVIISDAVRAKPELMQRDVPGRFELLWGYGLILEIQTDIVGNPKSRFKNTMVEVRHALRYPFGEAHVIVKMSPEDALTLYRATHPGMPTLLYPPR